MNSPRLPGPDHPIALTAPARRLRARYMGHVIADSADALMLEEAGYHAVAYFPREDVSMEFFSRSERRSHCPYKGDASYFSVLMDGELSEDAAWSYQDPYPAMEAIRGRIAFFPHPVEVYAIEEANPAVSTDEIVLHTDDGEGASQKAHWPPNTREPPGAR